MAYPNFDPNTDFGQPVRVYRVVIQPSDDQTPSGVGFRILPNTKTTHHAHHAEVHQVRTFIAKL